MIGGQARGHVRIFKRKPFKQCIARSGGGKSGRFRTIVLFQAGTRAFFVHGYAKSGQDNIRDDELAAFRMLAAEMLAYEDGAIARALASSVSTEVENG